MSATSAESDPPLKVKGLKKSFRQGSETVEAVRGVDFEADTGSFIAIMGPSGSGKSTFLHLLAGLTTPDEGTIEIEGKNIASMSDAQQTIFRRKRIGLVFQAYNLIPTLTAEKNILLPLALDGNDTARTSSLDMLLEQLGLSGRRHHRPDALSGGEQQRVAIARALITDPAIILADEPTGNLDTETTSRICEDFKKVCNERKKTLLLVTHEPSVAFHSDTICVMKDGRIGGHEAVSKFKNVEELALHYQAVVAGHEQEVATV